MAGADRLPRKHEQEYALALGRHILDRFPDMDQIVYFGDTHLNDASLIRNLQRQGMKATGFICEPELHIKNLWFNGIYYSDAWTDVLGYLEQVGGSTLGRKTLCLCDMDQTVWAPKGVLEAPLSAARTAAMHMLIDKYVEEGREEFRLRTRQMVSGIYRIIKGIAFTVLTEDNEDYKAAISICLALNLYKARNKRFSLLGDDKLATEELEWTVSEVILKPYMLDNGLAEFIGDVYAELDAPEVEQYAREKGIRLSEVRVDIRSVFRNIRNRLPTPYAAFRRYEFEQTMLRARRSGIAADEGIVINKTIWDVLAWLLERNVRLFGISDRPDEATYSGRESLLDCPMCVYGRAVAGELSRM